MCEDKKRIIEIFNQNVRGKKADLSNSNKKHDGNKGHWLEDQMGSTRDSSNKPDLFGYEMKTSGTSGKISFGDWSADEYIFLHGRSKLKNIHNTNKDYRIKKDIFIQIFGKSNTEKGGRYSWSGVPSPTYYNQRNTYGQILTIDNENNILITYDYSEDKRPDKATIVPKNMQKNNLILAKWKYASIKQRVEDKFNQNGWFTCQTDTNGYYTSIHFGKPINLETWIDLFKHHKVIFDSGMKQKESRNYSIWRSSTATWDSLIIDSY